MTKRCNLSDEQLLERIHVHDEWAFSELYDRYRPKVYSYALRIAGSTMVAEDIVQEVFMKMWQQKGFGHLGNVGAYLRVATRNQTLKWLRRSMLEADTEAMLSRHLTEVDRSTEEAVELKDIQEVIDHAVSLLPPQRRRIFHLCKNEGLKYDEVAEKTNLSRLTVKTHMQLSLRFLRAYMVKYQDLIKIFLLVSIYPN